MALLTQGDFDALAPQITNRKRTAGANNGKVMRDVVMARGYSAAGGTGAGNTSGDPPAVVAVTYTVGVVELLSFAGAVETYPPGLR